MTVQQTTFVTLAIVFSIRAHAQEVAARDKASRAFALAQFVLALVAALCTSVPF